MARTTAAARKLGRRSVFEKDMELLLDKAGVEHEFEPEVIPYEVSETRKYTPDFRVVTKSGKVFYIETKGRFLAKERKKHLLLQKQRPDLDIRFVFYRAKEPIRKGSKTTCGMWAEKNGFLWADHTIPKEWLFE